MGNTQKEIFISFATEKEDTARELCNKIEKQGISCFFAPRDIHAGKEYAGALADGIDHAKGLILLMSKGANESPHVLREVERAVRKKVPILMYSLEDVVLSKSMEYFLMTHQWIRAGEEGEKALMEFVEECVNAPRQEYEAEKGNVDSQNGNLKPKKKMTDFLYTKRGAAILTIVTIFLIMGAFLAVDFGFELGIVFDRKQETQQMVNYEPGDVIEFGSYQGKTIRWRILKLSEDGTRAVVVTEEIITMKAFDAAESGRYNGNEDGDYWKKDSEAESDMVLQAQVRGNNSWELSNIRTWLNSDGEVVEYENGLPADAAMSQMCNGYEYEPGFLHGFTEEEKARIAETRVVTDGTVLSEEDSVTLDKVFLLSREELKWFEEAGMHIVAVPGTEAVVSDETKWYQIYSLDYGTEYFYWWLRTPVEGSSSKCYMVSNGYTEEEIISENVGLEGYGIRPAMTLLLK